MKRTFVEGMQIQMADNKTNFLDAENFSPEFGSRIGNEAHEAIFQAGLELIGIFTTPPTINDAERAYEILSEVYGVGARHAVETLAEGARVQRIKEGRDSNGLVN